MKAISATLKVIDKELPQFKYHAIACVISAIGLYYSGHLQESINEANKAKAEKISFEKTTAGAVGTDGLSDSGCTTELHNEAVLGRNRDQL